MSEPTRAYIYRVILALVPVLLAVGVAVPGGVAIWVFLAAAILGIPTAGLATKFTSTHPEKLERYSLPEYDAPYQSNDLGGDWSALGEVSRNLDSVPVHSQEEFITEPIAQGQVPYGGDNG